MSNKENKNNPDQNMNEQENEKNQINNEENIPDNSGLESEGIKNEVSSEDKVAQLEKETAEFKEKLLRKAAEFENYKRRTENDQLNLIKYAAESFIVKLLPIIDDFERSMQHMDSAKDVESIRKGIHLVYDKFMKMLDEQGVKKIDAVGKPFDVHYHEALMQRKDVKAEPHTVLDEIEKGYMYKDRVIRHAKVVVSEEMTEESSPEADDKSNKSNLED